MRRRERKWLSALGGGRQTSRGPKEHTKKRSDPKTLRRDDAKSVHLLKLAVDKASSNLIRQEPPVRQFAISVRSTHLVSSKSVGDDRNESVEKEDP